MCENISEEANPMPEEQKVSPEQTRPEWRVKEKAYFAALEIKKRAFMEFKSEMYETLHRLLESLEEAYEQNTIVADELLQEAYDTMATDFLEVVERYAYNKARSIHFNEQVPL